MTTSPSVTGNLPLPRWAYVPGEAADATAEYETLAQIAVLVPPGGIRRRRPDMKQNACSGVLG